MRIQMNVLSLILLIVTAGVAVSAQSSPDSGPVTTSGPVLMQQRMMAMHVEMDVPVVKNLPFCATITTEHTQSFADGNRIHTSDNSMMCRDSEGRTRREAGLLMVGTEANKMTTKLVTVVDPVAGFRYMLDPTNKMAHKMPIKAVPGNDAAMRVGPGDAHFGVAAGVGEGNVVYRKKLGGPDRNTSTTENLGDQTIDGIQATGTRVTTTIPVGEMGNEQPITVTSEQWYSSQLKATIMTKHNDPWAGELKTQFGNVNTAEPDPSLFTVPSDYKVVDGQVGTFSFHAPPPPPQ